MKENIALLFAILYLIYRYKTYSRVNKIIEDSIENGHKPFYNLLTLEYNGVDLLALH